MTIRPQLTVSVPFIFLYGEHFYNFQGVREYKEKFDPKWEARYLASPGGLALPRILINIASLISGGLKGVVTKWNHFAGDYEAIAVTILKEVK